ncbi:MAG: hypothetical protein HRT90_12065 [Candidatus Margulisbacteria bacterium]|nr:hypothetical protein [Candidatus Margulisiibacteriota bacterium]
MIHVNQTDKLIELAKAIRDSAVRMDGFIEQKNIPKLASCVTNINGSIQEWTKKYNEYLKNPTIKNGERDIDP